MTTATRPAPSAEKIAANYARQEAILRDEIAELNALLGLADADALDRRLVTFGYIGNGKLTSNGWDLSDCLWFVFLPHPGRVGTSDDRVGGFATGDLAGIVATRRALASVAQGVRLARR